MSCALVVAQVLAAFCWGTLAFAEVVEPASRPVEKPLVTELPEMGDVPEDGKPLEGWASGEGFETPWNVQNKATGGYAVVRRPDMRYGDLRVSGCAVEGGESYLAAGRALTVGRWGAESRKVDQNGGETAVLGAPGSSVYLAVLLEKASENDQMVYVSLHGSTVPWLTGERVVGIGYFGEGSQREGRRVWSLEVSPEGGRERVLLPTTVPVEAGKPTLLVLAMHFEKAGSADPQPKSTQPGMTEEKAVPPAAETGAMARVELYVNPAVLGGDEPARPDVVQRVPAEQLRVHSIAVHLGDGTKQAWMAAMRMGRSFASVTPTSDGVEKR